MERSLLYFVLAIICLCSCIVSIREHWIVAGICTGLSGIILLVDWWLTKED